MKQSIQKIILFAAVLFAAGFNISANAQQAEFRVYTPSSGNVDLPLIPASNFLSFHTIQLDLSGTFGDIAMRLDNISSTAPINHPAETSAFSWIIVDSGTEIRAGSFGDAEYDDDWIPCVISMSVCAQSGNSVIIRAAWAGSQTRVITLFVYRNTGNDLALANTEDLASSVSDDEFFIRSDTGESTTTPHTLNIGYVAPNCTGATPIMETDGLSCREIEATDCGQNERPDFWDGSMCVADCGTGFTNPTNPGETCIAEIPPAATCGANAINDPNDNTMCVCENTETHEFVDGSTTMCELISEDNMEETEMEESQNPTTQTPQNRADNKKRRAESINTATGLLAVGVIAVFLAGGVPSFNMSPDFGYSITESGYYANISGRADFRKDNWHLYYFANQTNANGEFADFRYTSGGRYNGDLFVATFSESVAGETANYNFSLSADWTGQNPHINVNPVYRLHSEYDKGEFSTRNELNLQGNFRYDGWTINSSAGFRWENTKDFAENARFQINAIHRF